MSHSLEALLEAYDALRSAPAGEINARQANYEASLQEVATHLGIACTLLHQMIQRKYPSWLRAQKRKPSSMPPSA